MNLNEKHVALLNGSTFLVCGAFTIFVSPIMMRYDARTVLVLSALCNSIGTFLFIGVKDFYLMIVGRALSGLSQAMICTYAPVWISEFAPKAS